MGCAGSHTGSVPSETIDFVLEPARLFNVGDWDGLYAVHSDGAIASPPADRTEPGPGTGAREIVAGALAT